MWLIVAWISLTCLAMALVFKAYRHVVCFRSHVNQVMRDVRLNMGLKEWAVAEKYLAPILKKRKYRRKYLFKYIRILRELERFEEAEKLLGEAKRLKLSGSYFFLEVAHKAFRHGAYKEAAHAFSLLPSELLEECEVARYTISLVYLGEVDLACRIVEPWIGPLAHQEIYISVGHIHFATKRYAEAIDFYRRARSLGLCPVDVVYNLAHSLRICGHYVDAGMLFRELLSEPIYKDEAMFNIGLCEHKLGNSKKALLIYQNSELWVRGDALMMRYAALAAADQKDYQLAEHCWTLAFRCQSYTEDWNCCVHYGLALCHLKKYSEAEKVYLRVIQKTPDCLVACKALAWLAGVGYATMISAQDGIAYAKRALRIKRSPEVLELLSACEAREGNFDVAYDIQAILAERDTTPQERERRSQILKNLRQKLPIDQQHIVEVSLLLAA
ncbi:hypothetical protein [Chlamydia sp.]|uniref:tetratricopeptide repeat protein n=1 Tax=Chlamydia sp. TaxID=35827 RepID=UPI0025BBC5EA|nr:hypothetical protein [Chlamydia sp.]MBQ8498804.1 hypothetical protein [Chlamydia sp.]